ncbi:hypothetical protein IFM89_015141 [Coptis chinensis]|uniref:Uncharacterized protein n=1 Tax=Coptis chinensis TaxID=261450 RepID=A0A835HTV4_9MAGN|nr:hypothetical protein IFM89_015141 [Coptis chinensis]
MSLSESPNNISDSLSEVQHSEPRGKLAVLFEDLEVLDLPPTLEDEKAISYCSPASVDNSENHLAQIKPAASNVATSAPRNSKCSALAAWKLPTHVCKFFGNASPNVVSERSALIQECLRSILQSSTPNIALGTLNWFLYPQKALSSLSLLNMRVPQSTSAFIGGICAEDVPTFGKTISLLVDVQPHKPVKHLLEAQHYICAGCHKCLDTERSLMREFVQTLGWGKPRLCEYTALPIMVETVSTKILEHITQQCLVCCDVGIPCGARHACKDPSSLIFPFQGINFMDRKTRIPKELLSNLMNNAHLKLLVKIWEALSLRGGLMNHAHLKLLVKTMWSCTRIIEAITNAWYCILKIQDCLENRMEICNR